MKKKKGAKCEGTVIPGLAKVRKLRRSYTQQDEAPSNKEAATSSHSEVQDEEYILGRLLKKSLVNGAMVHDTIVDACKWLSMESCGRISLVYVAFGSV